MNLCPVIKILGYMILAWGHFGDLSYDMTPKANMRNHIKNHSRRSSNNLA